MVQVAAGNIAAQGGAKLVGAVEFKLDYSNFSHQRGAYVLVPMRDFHPQSQTGVAEVNMVTVTLLKPHPAQKAQQFPCFNVGYSNHPYAGTQLRAGVTDLIQ